MLSENTDTLISQLLRLGLEESEAKIYLSLQKKNPQSTLELSRNTRIGRTKTYEKLEKLEKRGLIVEIGSHRGKKFRPTSYQYFEELVQQKEEEAQKQRSLLPQMIANLEQLQMQSSDKSKILYYKGEQGLKQVTWNSLKAKGTLRLFELESMSAFLDYGYAEKVRIEFVRRGIKVQELTNHLTLDEWTNVAEFVKNHWECRYLPKSDMSMSWEMLIYNDVYCMYNYKDDEIMCIEIHNQALADMQKQIFDYMWNNAQMMKVASPGGRVELLTK